MKTSRTIAFALLMLVAPAIAHAQAATQLPPNHPTESQWYGWQTLSADGSAVFMVLAAGVAERNESLSRAFFYGAGATYVLGGPVVHAAHEQWGRAAGSLGLRVGLPIGLGFAGMGMEGCRRSSDFCGLAGFIVGFGVGMISAVVVDAAFLARETRPADASPEAAPSFSLHVTPVVSPDAKHAGVAVSGAF